MRSKEKRRLRGSEEGKRILLLWDILRRETSRKKTFTKGLYSAWSLRGDPLPENPLDLLGDKKRKNISLWEGEAFYQKKGSPPRRD